MKDTIVGLEYKRSPPCMIWDTWFLNGICLFPIFLTLSLNPNSWRRTVKILKRQKCLYPSKSSNKRHSNPLLMVCLLVKARIFSRVLAFLANIFIFYLHTTKNIFSFSFWLFDRCSWKYSSQCLCAIKLDLPYLTKKKKKGSLEGFENWFYSLIWVIWATTHKNSCSLIYEVQAESRFETPDYKFSNIDG